MKPSRDGPCHGGSVAEKINSVPPQDASRNERTLAQREEIATEKTLAILMIRGTDPTKNGTLIADLSNQFVKGKDEYPEDMASAATMLELYEPPVNQPARQRPPRNGATSSANNTSVEASAMTFAQTAGERSSPTYNQRVAASVAGTDGILHPGISCFGGCRGYRHYSCKCPGAPPTSVRPRVRPSCNWRSCSRNPTRPGLTPNGFYWTRSPRYRCSGTLPC